MDENVAVTFPAPREVSIGRVDRPTPDAGEVVVRTTRTLISTGTELALLTDRAQYTSLPVDAPGYAHVGRIVDRGDGVDARWREVRVATHGPHRRYVCVDVEDATPIPETVTDEAATFHALAAIAMNGVRRGRVTWGESAAVYGLGLVGQLAARNCRAAGAEHVIGMDPAADRRSYLPDRPGVSAIDPHAESVTDRVRAATGGRLADAVFEVTGNASAIEEQVAALADAGRFVILGSPRGVEPYDFYHDCHRPGYEIIGAHARTHPDVPTPANPWTRSRHRELFFSLLSQERLGVAELISHRASYADAPAMYDLLLEDRTRALGVVLDWEE